MIFGGAFEGGVGARVSHDATPPVPLGGQIIFDGNSLTAVPSSTYPPRVMASLGSNWLYHNFGVGGQTTTEMLADVATQIDVLYDTNLSKNVVICWEWRNAISVDEHTIEQTYADCVTYCQGRQAVGFQVVVLTVLPRAYETYQDFENKRLAVNALIRANWGNFADALADVGTDSTIGPVDAADNIAYYYDGMHLTDAGYTIVANIVIAALATL
jgi:hypothetical protein